MDDVTVYVVTSGDYSDYGIQRVFLDADEANRYCEVENTSRLWSKADVEEYIVSELGEPLITHEISVTIAKDSPLDYGDSRRVYWDGLPDDKKLGLNCQYAYRLVGNYPARIFISAEDTDEDRARKIVTDTAIQILAEFDAAHARLSG